MRVSPIPRGVYPSVTALDPKALRARGITLVLADLDNTLVPYGVTEPPEEIVAWKQALEAQGIQLFLLSNSRRPGRAQGFAQRLGIPYQGHSGKPRRAGYLRAMERMGRRPEETVMVGDQIFTDVLGGRRAGCRAVLVQPIQPEKMLFFRLKRALEAFAMRCCPQKTAQQILHLGEDKR